MNWPSHQKEKANPYGWRRNPINLSDFGIKIAIGWNAFSGIGQIGRWRFSCLGLLVQPVTVDTVVEKHILRTRQSRIKEMVLEEQRGLR